MFKTEVQQALRALVALARAEGPVTIAVLAAEVEAPAPMLGKVLHRLSRLGLVVGQPGPGGGYRLARPGAEIRLADVIEPLEGPGFARTCVFGLPQCSDEQPCPLHGVWGQVRRGLLWAMEECTVADLAGGRLSTPALAAAAGLPTLSDLDPGAPTGAR